MKKILIVLSFVLAAATPGLFAQAVTAPVVAESAPDQPSPAKEGKHGKKHHKHHRQAKKGHKKKHRQKGKHSAQPPASAEPTQK